MQRLATQKTGWLPLNAIRKDATARLFCFPPAGGSSVLYRNWDNFIHPAIDVCPIELPGRGRRHQEPAFSAVAPLIDELSRALAPWLDKPFAFFGHSMGALVAFELARHLSGTVSPLAIFLAARKAPQVPSTNIRTYDLPRDEFIGELRKYASTPEKILAHEEVLEVVLPMLRADFELCQTYRYIEGPRLSCPILAYGGLQDTGVLREDLLAWKAQTSAAFSLSMVPGNHFFLEQLAFQRVLSKHVTALLDRCDGLGAPSTAFNRI